MATVLVVDDRPEQLNWLKKTVAQVRDATALEASSEQQAIDIINERDYLDVVVTDLRMETKLSGIEVVKAASQAGERRGVPLPVIVVTSFGDNPTTEKGMTAGAFDWIDRESTYYDSELMLRHKIQWALRYVNAASRQPVHQG